MHKNLRFAFLITLSLFLVHVLPANCKAFAAAPADDEFVMKAAAGGKMEVELGRLAARKGRNASVKHFGRRMVADHARAGNQLKRLAAKKGISLPAEMDAEGKEAMNRLSSLRGAEFDRAYIDMMVSDHEKDVSEFENEATSGTDNDVKSFAKRTLPTLKMHLRMARSTAAKVGH